MKHRFLIVVATLVAAAFVAPVAFAGSPANTQYPKAAVLVTKTSKAKGVSTKPLSTAKSTGTLPFTGTNLALAAGLAAAALAGGVALRKTARRNPGE